MSDCPPISPLDCQHFGSLLIASHRSSPPPERHIVTVCPRCGQFTVSGMKEGVHFRVEFDLPSRRLVEAAGRYCEYLEGEENSGKFPDIREMTP